MFSVKTKSSAKIVYTVSNETGASLEAGSELGDACLMFPRVRVSPSPEVTSSMTRLYMVGFNGGPGAEASLRPSLASDHCAVSFHSALLVCLIFQLNKADS